MFNIKFDDIKNDTILGFLAILMISIIELYALSLGQNGTMLSLSIGAISGVAGFDIARRKWKEKPQEGPNIL